MVTRGAFFQDNRIVADQQTPVVPCVDARWQQVFCCKSAVRRHASSQFVVDHKNPLPAQRIGCKNNGPVKLHRIAMTEVNRGGMWELDKATEIIANESPRDTGLPGKPYRPGEYRFCCGWI